MAVPSKIDCYSLPDEAARWAVEGGVIDKVAGIGGPVQNPLAPLIWTFLKIPSASAQSPER